MRNPLLLLLLLAVVGTLIPLTESPESTQDIKKVEDKPVVPPHHIKRGHKRRIQTPLNNLTDNKIPTPQASPPTVNVQPDPKPPLTDPQHDQVSINAAPAPTDSSIASKALSTPPSPSDVRTTPELWHNSPNSPNPSPFPQQTESNNQNPNVIHYVYQPAIRNDDQSSTEGESYESAGQPLEQDMRDGTLSVPKLSESASTSPATKSLNSGPTPPASSSSHGTPSPPATHTPISNDTSLHMSLSLIIMYVIMLMLLVAVMSGLIVVAIMRCPRMRSNQPLHQSSNTATLSPKSTQSTYSCGTLGRPVPNIPCVGTATAHQYNNLPSVRNSDNFAIPISVPVQQSHTTHAQYLNERRYRQQEGFIWASAVEPGKNQTTITSNPTYVSARESVGDLSLFAQTTSTKRNNDNTIREEYHSPMTMSSLAGCSGMSDVSACVDYGATDKHS